MPTVFIVEDDENIRELVLYALRSAGFTVSGFESGFEFWNSIKMHTPDAVLLDIMLPDEDGISLLKKIRAHSVLQSIPVIMLTAKSSEYDAIKGLDAGADDYISKPFGVMELISRLKAVLRRSSSNTKKHMQSVLQYNDIILDTEKHIVSILSKMITLTAKEFALLQYLLEHISLVLTREKILEIVWGFEFIGETRTVDVHIKTLRQKLGSSGSVIQTVRGIGYKIE